MSAMPSASVIVCTYNRKQWLEKCLAALGPELRAGSEIIVVDGPSTDGTRELLEVMESAGTLKLVRQPTLAGISSARNLGLDQANCEIVCFVDDDALIEPGWMSAILAPFEDARIGGVGGPVLDLEGREVMGRNAVSKMGDWSDAYYGDDIDGLSPVMVGCNMSFRTAALRAAGGFDPRYRYHQDETDACLRVQAAGWQIAYSEEARVRHAWCEGSYRKDRLLWYLRLRYLWGRNTAYLVSKNFSDDVTLAGFLAHKLSGGASARVKNTSSGHAATDTARVPRPMSAFGAAFELAGALMGWRLAG